MGSFFEREAKSEPPVSEERSSCVSELATTWRSTIAGRPIGGGRSGVNTVISNHAFAQE